MLDLGVEVRVRQSPRGSGRFAWRHSGEWCSRDRPQAGRRRAEDIGASALAIPGAAPPTAAPGKWSPWMELEAEDNTRGVAEVVPVHLIGRSWYARQQVIQLAETNSKVGRGIPIEPDARA